MSDLGAEEVVEEEVVAEDYLSDEDQPNGHEELEEEICEEVVIEEQMENGFDEEEEEESDQQLEQLEQIEEEEQEEEEDQEEEAEEEEQEEQLEEEEEEEEEQEEQDEQEEDQEEEAEEEEEEEEELSLDEPAESRGSQEDQESRGQTEEPNGQEEEPQESPWSELSGQLKTREFSAEELALFRRPFELGWTRELVLRAGLTSAGKKVGDVYYFSPDKRHKLRSYVNMQDYLRKTGSPLKAENFTFARQPVHRPPQEIVRHAMHRGEHPRTTQQESPPRPSRSNRNSTNSESDDQGRGGEVTPGGLAEGRARRKRVAPSRFEDENYESETPFKKRSLLDRKSTNGQPAKPTGPMSLQEKRRQLQHQLLQQVHDKIQEQQKEEHGHEPLLEPTVEVRVKEEPNKEIQPIRDEDSEPKNKETKSARKSISLPRESRDKEDASSAVREEVEEADEVVKKTEEEKESESEREEKGESAPCSMHCPGRRGMLPNLMCSRCFCLYHLDCVPGGVFLEEPRVFVCPNCLSPEDQKRAQEGQPISQSTAPALFVSTAPLLLQPTLQKPRSTFAPILPKPPQLRESAIYQQMFRRSRLPNVNGSGKTRVPQFRVTTGPNGHSMVVKDTKARPKVVAGSGGKRPNQPSAPVRPLDAFSLYRPERPIAPIAPLKLTPQQIERQLRHLLTQSDKKRGYKEWVERRRRPLAPLLAPFESLNQVLQYLTVRDLVRLRQVSRAFHQLSAQPHLWRCLRLKNVVLVDWQFLAKNIVESNNSVLIDFEGVRAPPTELLSDFWRNFAAIVDYLKSVRTLRFGSVPHLVLEEISSAAITENPYNSFSLLQVLEAKNLMDEDQPHKEVSLAFLKDFHALEQLHTLSLGSRAGFRPEEDTVDLLQDVFSRMPALTTLSLLNLKDFLSEDFRFLSSLQNISHLSIGSCATWFAQDGAAFTSLSALTRLVDLRLQEIRLVGSEALILPKTLSSLTRLQSLCLDDLLIRKDGAPVADELCSVLTALPLKKFSVSTADPLTNRVTVKVLKKLDNCEKLLWKVESLVEDSGECFVAFQQEGEGHEGEHNGHNSPELMDLTFLNEVIQSDLSHAFIEIIPQ